MRCALWLTGAALMMSGCATNNVDPAMPMVERPGPGSPLYGPTFVERSASMDQFEIQKSQMALQMSQNPAIRQYAQMIINDHQRMSSEMMGAAQGLGIAAPGALLPEHAQMLQSLQAAGPAGFDASYKQIQIAAHQEALNMYQSYATCGDRAALRALAANGVPMLQQHLNQAQALPLMDMTPPPPPPPTGGERG